ncbi:DUF4231 domain-containing protein [Vibrio vulnificus]|nr:DUF4231 domain-containing protein [Vibrio vulnificus]EIZ1050354.1 DUF4231 domain-containing protein [Vibrio vulnificus]
MKNKAEVAVNSKILHFKKKADHNKLESLWSFKLIMISTLSSPLFVAFGTTEFYSKIVPAFLSLIAAGLTAWVQLRKPQNLWKTYRTAQRRLEVELEKYQFEIGEYSGDDKDKKVITKASDIYVDVHEQWSDLVPSPDDIKSNPSKEEQPGV